jgi:hypothetical protein
VTTTARRKRRATIAVRRKRDATRRVAKDSAETANHNARSAGPDVARDNLAVKDNLGVKDVEKDAAQGPSLATTIARNGPRVPDPIRSHVPKPRPSRTRTPP